MRSGGGYLGKGTYGCTFNPALPCKDGKSHPGDIGKVHFDETYALYEKKVGELLEKIDPSQSSMIYPVDRGCSIDKLDLFSDGEKCIGKNSRDYRLMKSDLLQMLMKYGGVSLSQYIKSRTNKLSRREALSMLFPVFEAVKKLVKVGYVHQDIKGDNIVVSQDKEKAKLIDFGALKIASSSDPESSFYNPENFWFDVDYYAVGPEYRIRRADYWHNSRSVDVSEMLEVEKDLMNRLHITQWKKEGLDIFDKDYVDKLSAMADAFYLSGKSRWNLTMSNPESVFNLLKARGIHDKVDLYSIGVVLLSMWPALIPASSDEPMSCSLFNKLVHSLLRPDPASRPTIDEAMRQVRRIINVASTSPTPVIANRTSSRSRPLPPTPIRPECPPGKIMNPKTKRCVNIDGAIGKKILANKTSSPPKDCTPSKIRNPTTGRCVKRSGKIGKMLAVAS